MVYTVGNSKSYRRAIAKYGLITKTGRTDDYEGGIIFLTRENAERYIKEYNHPNWEVFGVLADWDKDTLETEDYWHWLLIDSPIAILENT